MNSLDLCFPVRATTVPRDHGYALYGAICRELPSAHNAEWLAVHPLSGGSVDEDRLALRDGAALILRLPAERIPDVLSLAGRTLEIGSARLLLGAPNVRALAPASSLDARLVVIKLTDAPRRENPELGREALDMKEFAERYVAELTRQLAKIGITSPPQLCGRRSIRVGGSRIVGYSVRVDGLDADQSIALQMRGIGGKRRMGCGLFRPTRAAAL